MVSLSMVGSSASGAYGNGGSVNDITVSYSFLPLSFFEGVGEAEHRRFVEVLRQNLHSDRKPFGGIAARYAHARYARQTSGNGKNVREVHGQGVVHLLSQLESRERRDRRHKGIHLLKCVGKIARDQRAHFLRFQVVRIIVSRT